MNILSDLFENEILKECPARRLDLTNGSPLVVGAVNFRRFLTGRRPVTGYWLITWVSTTENPTIYPCRTFAIMTAMTKNLYGMPSKSHARAFVSVNATDVSIERSPPPPPTDPDGTRHSDRRNVAYISPRPP